MKEIRKGLSTITDKNKDTIVEQFIQEIKNIQKEILINLDVTEKIPEYVSKCIGAYIWYYIEDEQLNYNVYVLFEFLKGFPLNSYLEKYSSKRHNSTFVLPQKSKLLISINKCLRALHSIGYVHRDIKPENIYVVSDSDIEGKIAIKRCILIDFGESLKIGETLNIEQGDIKGDYYYNPFIANPIEKNGVKRFNWKKGKTGASIAENMFAFNAMKHHRLPYGFQITRKSHSKKSSSSTSSTRKSSKNNNT